MNVDDPDFVPSPCISECCLNEDDVCVGCFRHVDEITGWHSASNVRRKEIIANTEKRREKRQSRL